MFPYAVLIRHVVVLLMYLAGLVVAIFLLVRAKGRAAILAAVGFALLVLISIGQIVLTLPPVSREFYRVGGQWSVWVYNCCCSIFDIAAIVCLIVAIWQAVSGTGTENVAQKAEPLGEGMVVDVFEGAEGVASATVKLEETSGKNPYATRVLEETLEGEILEDTEAESAYTTQVLRDMQEEVVEESE